MEETKIVVGDGGISPIENDSSQDSVPVNSNNSQTNESVPRGVPVSPISSVQPPVSSQSLNTTSTTKYVSNPFINAAQGLVKILSVNPVSAMLSALIIFIAIALYEVIFWIFTYQIGQIGNVHNLRSIVTRLLIISFVLFISYIIIIPVYVGISSIIGASSINDEVISLAKATKRSFSKYFSLLIAGFLLLVLTEIGLILFIIPGLIVIARLALTFLVMFEEDKGPIESMSKSWSMTKGHTFEMMGSFLASWYISGGYLLITAVSMAPLVGRYEEIKNLQLIDGEKPKTHWMNYFLLVATILVVIGTVVGLILIGDSAAKNSSSTTPKISPVTTSTQVKQTTNNTNQTLNDVNAAAAATLPISNQFLTNLNAGNATELTNLETTSFQQKYTSTQMLALWKSYNLKGYTNQITSLGFGYGPLGEQAVYYGYTYTGQGSNFYVIVGLEKYNGTWGVNLVNGTLNPVKPQVL